MNNLGKVSAASGSLALFLSLVPAHYAIYPAGLIVLCSLLRAVIQPPAAESRWAVPYQIITILAANVAWAVPRLRPGISVVDVARGDKSASEAALASAGITPLSSTGTPKT